MGTVFGYCGYLYYNFFKRYITPDYIFLSILGGYGALMVMTVGPFFNMLANDSVESRYWNWQFKYGVTVASWCLNLGFFFTSFWLQD